MKTPSRLKAHILKPSVNEINKMTDIHIEWEMIKKSKKDIKVRFKSTKQDDDRLRELGLLEDPIETNPFYDRAREKLEIRKQRGQEIYDDVAWIKEDLRRNSVNYQAMDEINRFLTDNDQEVKNDFYLKLADMLNASDPILTIENYIIKEMFGDKTYSKNAAETQNLLVDVVEQYYP